MEDTKKVRSMQIEFCAQETINITPDLESIKNVKRNLKSSVRIYVSFIFFTMVLVKNVFF